MQANVHSVDLFPERLRNRRIEVGYTQSTLAKAMNKGFEKQQLKDSKGDIIKVTNRSVYSWERGGHFPRPKIMQVLCQVLDVSESYLMGSAGKNSAVPSIHRITDKNEIAYYNREPLYIIERGDLTAGYWVIVDISHHALYSPFLNRPMFIDDLDMENIAVYTRNPIENILPLEKCKISDNVYLYPFFLPPKDRKVMRGWYKYNVESLSFIKNDASVSLPENMYGITYIGFADVPTYL